MKEWYFSTVTSKGQTTVPRAVRDALGVKPHDKLKYVVDNGCVTVEAVDLDIEDLFGKFKPVPGADVSDWDKVRQDAWDEVVQDRIRRMAEE
jgi:bifunctional DNA-binding transcriptional regulator/antitoxin component of YhaV-PrlF toxin-antitoxin module